MSLTSKMSSRWNAPICTALRITTLIGVSLSLSACAEYLDRMDTVTRHSGEAQAFNKATQTIDPWPRAAQKGKSYGNGERTRIAVDRYRANESIEPKTPNGDAEVGGTSGTSSGPAPSPSN